ncbi:MAG TPA: SAM-dependent methyltransferase [Pseudonocardiaceae bacterium]
MAAEELSWVPDDVDLSKPNAARVYDYYLGGANNFDVDRVFAKKIAETVPDVAFLAIENRSFLRRAVKFMAEQGIRQFIDLGSGIPTVGNTHEIAQAVDPSTRVVYVDIEAVAVAHSELILADNPNADIVRADLREPESVLTNPQTTALIDFGQPVAIMAYSSIHFVSDEADPARIIAAYRDATVSGSYLSLSHGTADGRPEVGEAVQHYQKTANPGFLRSRAEVTALFDGYELVEPGIVYTPEWRGELDVCDPWRASAYAGVGRKA